MNPNDFDNLINSALNEDGKLPSGGKSKKERYKDPKTKAMLKRSVAKHDAKTDSNGDNQAQKRDRARQARDNPNGKWGKKMNVSKPGTKTCSKPGCTNKATEADHVSRSGNQTQDLCKSCHQKVTDSRRENNGLDLNSFDRVLSNVLAEAEPPRDNPESMKYRGEKDPGGYKGRAKAGRFRKLAYPKKLTQQKYPLRLFKHPTDNHILIAPKGDLKDDFATIENALKPNTYYKVEDQKGNIFIGKLLQGTLSVALDKSTKGTISAERESERLVKLYDIRSGEIVTIPKFKDMNAPDEEKRMVGGAPAVTGREDRQIVPIITATEINEEDHLDNYWAVHSKIIQKALIDAGKSEFKDALAPHGDESQKDYESRVKSVHPREDLFSYYNALEINKNTGNYRWLSNAASEANISRIAALVPKNMGASAIDLLGNITKVDAPNWLMDPRTGKSNVEPAEGVDEDDIIKPTKSQYDKKKKEKPIRSNVSYISLNDLKRQREGISLPYSAVSLETSFNETSKAFQKEYKQKGRDSVISGIAVELSGDSQGWPKLDKEKQAKYLEQAETEYKENKEYYAEAFKKATLQQVYLIKIRQLGMEELAKLKVCAICNGDGKVSSASAPLTGRMAEPLTPIPGADLKASQKMTTGEAQTEKCTSCNGSGLAPISTTLGYQPKRTAEEIDGLAKSTYQIMQKFFRATCQTCDGTPSEETPCSDCDGSGFDYTKLQAVQKEWGDIMRNSLGDDYFDDEDSMLFAQKLFKKIADVDKGYGRVSDSLDNDYAIVYDQTSVDDSLVNNKLISNITRPLAKGDSVKWGFHVKTESDKDDGSYSDTFARTEKQGIPVPYESKHKDGPRRMVPVSRVYDEQLSAKENRKRTNKGKLKPYFIEIKKFATPKKHYENEIRNLASTDPKLRNKFANTMQGADKIAAMKEVFRNNKSLVKNAMQTYEPQANSIEGVGLITSISVGRQEEYEHAGETAAVEYAELHGKDYSSLSDKSQQLYQQQAYAVRLAAQDQGVDIDRIGMKKLIALWNKMSEVDQTEYRMSAQMGGSRLYGSDKGGQSQLSLPVKSYAVNYIDVSTGAKGRIVLKSNDFLSLVEPLSRMKRRGVKLAEKRAKENPNLGDRVEAAVKRSVESPSEESGPEAPMENILRTMLPKRLIRKNYDISDIAEFID